MSIRRELTKNNILRVICTCVLDAKFLCILGKMNQRLLPTFFSKTCTKLIVHFHPKWKEFVRRKILSKELLVWMRSFLVCNEIILMTSFTKAMVCTSLCDYFLILFKGLMYLVASFVFIAFCFISCNLKSLRFSFVGLPMAPLAKWIM